MKDLSVKNKTMQIYNYEEIRFEKKRFFVKINSYYLE